MSKAKSNIKRAHLFVEGKVQGVGFRYFTQTNARDMNINGWVKNLPDGRVEAVFEAPKTKVENMIDRCKEGPRAARVDNLDWEWVERPQALNTFEVKYS